MPVNPHLLLIVDHILDREGGVSNNPNDLGGLTSFGITLPFLSDRIGHDATPADLMKLTRASAKQIYCDWLQDVRIDQLLEPSPSTTESVGGLSLGRIRLVDAIADWCVNAGNLKGVKLLQECLGLSGPDIDGIIGPRTMQHWLMADPSRVLALYIKGRIRHRVKRVKQDHSQLEFLSGWIERDMAFL